MFAIHDSAADLLMDDLGTEASDVVLDVELVEVLHDRERLLVLLLPAIAFQVDLNLSAEELACNLGGVVVRHLPEEVSLREGLDAGYWHDLLLMP